MPAAGRFFLTPHAVRRYMERLAAPGLTYEQALGALLREIEGAHRVRDGRAGCAIWRTGRPGRLRLIVDETQHPLPAVVTILPSHDR